MSNSGFDLAEKEIRYNSLALYNRRFRKQSKNQVIKNFADVIFYKERNEIEIYNHCYIVQYMQNVHIHSVSVSKRLVYYLCFNCINNPFKLGSIVEAGLVYIRSAYGSLNCTL